METIALIMARLSEHGLRVADYLIGGGPVMIPLLLTSLLMWVLIFQRVFCLRRLYRVRLSRAEARFHVQEGRMPDRPTGIVARLVADFLVRRTGRRDLDRFILDESVLGLVRDLDRHLALIGALAAAAPLLGLLGTVVGMITTFDIIAVYGTGNARAMAGGISEALITTQTGLLVAIPGLYMKHFLARRAENLKQQVAAVGMYLQRWL